MTALLEEVSRDLVLPRFRRLRDQDVERKPSASDPEDIVTIVDREVEEWLTKALTTLSPATVIGEEAVHGNPDRLRSIASDEPLWILDPIDGTKNFARGDDGFAVMVAWVLEGRARAAWLLLPARQRMIVAEAGSGAFVNGERLMVPDPPASGLPRGSFLTRYMPETTRASIDRGARGRYQPVPDSACAAVEYTDVMQGNRDFVVYYRLMPWDHAAPALILEEAGGRVEHLDGRRYGPRSQNQVTVVARDGGTARRVRDWLTLRPDAGEL